MNVKVFNLIWRVNKTRYLFQNESCQCECGLMKEHLIQTRNKIKMNVGVSANNLINCGSCINEWLYMEFYDMWLWI